MPTLFACTLCILSQSQPACESTLVSTSATDVANLRDAKIVGEYVANALYEKKCRVVFEEDLNSLVAFDLMAEMTDKRPPADPVIEQYAACKDQECRSRVSNGLFQRVVTIKVSDGEKNPVVTIVKSRAGKSTKREFIFTKEQVAEMVEYSVKDFP